MPSSYYFHPSKLPTLLAHLSTVQPSVPLSEQTTNLGVHWILKKGPECSLAEVYSDDFPFIPFCGWHYGAWDCLRPKEGRMEGAGHAQLRGLATWLSLFWVSLA